MKGISRLSPTVLWERGSWDGSKSTQQHIVKSWSNKLGKLQTTMAERDRTLSAVECGMTRGPSFSANGLARYFVSYTCKLPACACVRVCVLGL